MILIALDALLFIGLGVLLVATFCGQDGEKW